MYGATLQQGMSEETWDSLHSMWKLRPSGRVAKIKFKTEVPPVSCQPVRRLTLSGLHTPQCRGTPITIHITGMVPRSWSWRASTPGDREQNSNFPCNCCKRPAFLSIQKSVPHCMSADPNALAPVSSRAWPQPGALRGKKITKPILFQKQLQGGAQPQFLPHHFI